MKLRSIGGRGVYRWREDAGRYYLGGSGKDLKGAGSSQRGGMENLVSFRIIHYIFLTLIRDTGGRGIMEGIQFSWALWQR